METGNGLIRRGSEYPLTDGQGTTKLVTNSSQAVTSGQETEAFGRTIGGTGSTSSPFGYHGAAGYRSDGDGPAGLEPYQKVGARYYDATFGRFITRDTELGQSPYAYCDGDPVNCSDPSGHFTIDIAHRGLPISGGMDPGNAIGSNSDWLIAASTSSGTVSTPDGNGGKVTASPNGDGTITDTKGDSKISASGITGGLFTVKYVTQLQLGRGWSATGSGSYTPSTDASSHTFDLNYTKNNFSGNVGGGSDGSWHAGVTYKF